MLCSQRKQSKCFVHRAERLQICSLIFSYTAHTLLSRELANANTGVAVAQGQSQCLVIAGVAGSIPLVCMSKCPWARY